MKDYTILQDNTEEVDKGLLGKAFSPLIPDLSNPSNGSERVGNSLSAQEESTCLTPAAPQTPPERQTVKTVGEKFSNIPDSRESMAESVTRHAQPHLLMNSSIYYLALILSISFICHMGIKLETTPAIP
jgi:hypothetical protein